MGRHTTPEPGRDAFSPSKGYVLYHIAGYLAVISIGRLRFLCAAAHGFNSQPAGQGEPDEPDTRQLRVFILFFVGHIFICLRN